MGSLTKHAKDEFVIAGWYNQEAEKYCDDLQELMCEQTLGLLGELEKCQHSGNTIGYAVSLFSKLAMRQTIADLTGQDDEWWEYEDGLFQNKRYPSIFKNKKNGRSYETCGIVFRRRDGVTFTSGNSRRWIKFPYDTTKSAKYYPAWTNEVLTWVNRFLSVINLHLLRPKSRPPTGTTVLKGDDTANGGDGNEGNG